MPHHDDPYPFKSWAKYMLPLWICSLRVFYQSHGKVMNTSLWTWRFHSSHRNPPHSPRSSLAFFGLGNSTPKPSVSVLDTQLNRKAEDNHSNFLCLNLMYQKEEPLLPADHGIDTCTALLRDQDYPPSSSGVSWDSAFWPHSSTQLTRVFMVRDLISKNLHSITHFSYILICP